VLFLIAHFQKAALLMFSDRLADALRRLEITRPESVRQFKRAIRSTFEAFLRFTHRYWFHEISEQAQVRALFQMCSRHLGLDPLYEEVKERIGDMNDYLDADSLRRQANTVVRLTVVTILGLIGTITTGFLGMNLIAEADAPMGRRLGIFAVVFIVTLLLTAYTINKSKGLSDFLDALSDDRMSFWNRVKIFVAIWRPGPRD
jgi:Mg2+ and Co2+ transporter CorA